jgi:copper chaperone CopZ
VSLANTRLVSPLCASVLGSSQATAATTLKVSVSVGGMTCDECAKKIEKRLGALPGVVSVTVLLSLEQCNVTYAEIVDVDRILLSIVRPLYSTPHCSRSASLQPCTRRCISFVVGVFVWQTDLGYEASVIGLPTPLTPRSSVSTLDTHPVARKMPSLSFYQQGEHTEVLFQCTAFALARMSLAKFLS